MNSYKENVSKYYAKLPVYFAYSVIGMVVVVTAVFYAQYYTFKLHAEKLLALKHDYSSYVTSLKRCTSSSSSERREDYDATEAASALISGEDDGCVEMRPFVVVNREPEYLRASALNYAKAHNLEWALHELYSSNDWVLATHGRAKKANMRAHRYPKKPLKTPKKAASKQVQSRKPVKHMPKNPIFSWPLDPARFPVSSRFGPRKNVGLSRKLKGMWGFHYGIDLAAPIGTPVKAAADGVVVESVIVKSVSDKGFGNTIVVKHLGKRNTYTTRYAHLSQVLVAVNQRVKRGDIIGKVGNTGSVRSRWGGDGAHLHLEVQVFNKQGVGKKVNPLWFLA